MIAAVTVHYGEPDHTRRLLQALESYDNISNIVAVQHGEYTQQSDHFRVVFLQQKNRGYAAGVNRALRYLEEAGVPNALILNPDVTIREEQITALRAEHADCTFPAIKEGNTVLHGYNLSRFGSVVVRTSRPRFFPGTCFLISIEAWKKAGGMSEEYFHYFEDFDFCLRLEKAGCKIHHVASVVIEHTGKSGTDYPATELPRYAVRNHLLFLRKLGRLNALSFVNVTLRHLMYLLRWPRPWRGFCAWFKGIREFLKMEAIIDPAS